MTDDGLSPECRLARQAGEYESVHDLCHGTGDVRTPSGDLVYRHCCACTCHAGAVSETGVSAR